MEKISRGLHQLFNKSFGLKTTIEPPNIKIVNFLDVRLNLASYTFCPYKKPNDTTMYVYTKSNHPPTVLKEVPKSINKILSKISRTEREFNATKDEYQKDLNESGYKYKLAYEKPKEPKEKTKKAKET